MLYSLSSSSIRKRYFANTHTFPHRDVQRLTNLDYQKDLAIVGAAPRPDGEEIVAIAQYFLNKQSRVAEVAFIVQDEWQAKGIGTLLLRHITQVAYSRGVKEFYATVLPENKAMLALFKNSGYEMEMEFDGDSYIIRYNLDQKAAD